MIAVVAGAGGVGKSTVVARVLELDPTLWLSRSWTTRTRRPGEPADAYHFVDRDTFMARVAAGGFLEWTEFPGTDRLYGTPTLEAPPGRDVLLEIEVDGAQQVRAKHPDAVVIFVVAPTAEVQRGRLEARGDERASVEHRIAVGRDEEAIGRRIADRVVVNDDVERAAREVAGILADRRG